MRDNHSPEYPAKRALDIVLVLVTLPVWAPAIALIAVVARARIGPGVFFRQTRPGRHGRPFEMLKFRTMTDARNARGELLPEAERITSFGRKLRASSLDELPELWNVLRGDMSLVGPRPLLMQYLPRFSERHRRRHDVRPGMTGLAQVEGRNALGWEERFELDVAYVERCSIWLDLQILYRTIRAVLWRTGVTGPSGDVMPEFTGYSPASGSDTREPRR